MERRGSIRLPSLFPGSNPSTEKKLAILSKTAGVLAGRMKVTPLIIP